MALVGILSSQLIYQQFVEDFAGKQNGLTCEPDLLINRRSGSSDGRKKAC